MPRPVAACARACDDGFTVARNARRKGGAPGLVIEVKLEQEARSGQAQLTSPRFRDIDSPFGGASR